MSVTLELTQKGVHIHTNTVTYLRQVERATQSDASPVEAVMPGLQQMMVNW